MAGTFERLPERQRDGASLLPPPRDRRVFAKLALANQAAVAATYGQAAADRLLAAMIDRAEQFLVGAAALEYDAIGLDLVIADPLTLASRPAAAEADLLEALLAELSLTPVNVGRDCLVLPLVIGVAERRADRAAALIRGFVPESVGALARRLHAATPALGSPGASEWMCDLYARDMAVAVAVASALRDDHVALLWEPVAGGVNEAEILYCEGNARILNAAGDMREAGEIVPALERTGLIRALDYYVVRKTLDRLRQNPEQRLGCNISAQSSLIDGWWSSIFAELEADPDLAARLVIEVAGGVAAPTIDLMVEFTDRLRRLGCCIATDGFGADATRLGQLRALRPDIVKIDGWYLARIGDGDDARRVERLRHLTGFAATLAETVVVQGVDCDRGLEIARAAGGRWFQGRRLGGPCLTLRREYGATFPLRASASLPSLAEGTG